MKWIKRVTLMVLLLVVMMVLIGICVLVVQGQQTPDTHARYVALGSSFAAGIGLGERAPGSPFVCKRSMNGYPQQLARLRGLSLADMTCSGATIEHVLRGGQLFQYPQIDAVGPDTELVTITAGGNDIDYVGDLVMMSYRNRGGVSGFIIESFWQGAKPVEARQFARLKSNMVDTLRQIAHRAPRAQIVVVTYPTLLPPAGTCAQIGIGESDATLMREVGARLVAVTREATPTTKATFVDMAAISSGHDACSTEPWVNGATPAKGVPFHPTLAGAHATAKQILLMLGKP